MPIKYQMLGGGGGQTLMITTNPNVQVKLSNEKYSKTITTNAHGQAEFKNLKAGRYTCVVQVTSSKALTQNIFVSEFQNENLGILSKAKDIPLREKIKLSNGMEFTIMGKNVKYHQTNSVTLICNVGIDACTSNQYAYGATNMPGLSTEYYNALQQYEKTQIILHSFYFEHYKNSSYQNPVPGYEQTTGYFYAPSYNEMFGTRDNGKEEGVPLGFENAKDKIKHDRYGDACAYATRDATYRDRDNIYGYYWLVTPSGTSAESYNLHKHGVDKCLFLPCCDIKGDTWLTKKDDGYWHIDRQ